jgi:hypothetical protein
MGRRREREREREESANAVPVNGFFSGNFGCVMVGRGGRGGPAVLTNSGHSGYDPPPPASIILSLRSKKRNGEESDLLIVLIQTTQQTPAHTLEL